MNLEQMQSLLQQALDFYESKLNFALMILQKDQDEIAEFYRKNEISNLKKGLLQENQDEVAEFYRKKAFEDLKILVNVVGKLDTALTNVTTAIKTLEKLDVIN